LQLPAQLVDAWQLRQDPEPFVDLFSQQTLAIDAAAATLSVSIPALGSLVLQRNGNAKPAAKNASK
jgi:hypothetical protein